VSSCRSPSSDTFRGYVQGSRLDLGLPAGCTKHMCPCAVTLHGVERNGYLRPAAAEARANKGELFTRIDIKPQSQKSPGSIVWLGAGELGGSCGRLVPERFHVSCRDCWVNADGSPIRGRCSGPPAPTDCAACLALRRHTARDSSVAPRTKSQSRGAEGEDGADTRRVRGRRPRCAGQRRARATGGLAQRS
jgi:hypothetical protein